MTPDVQATYRAARDVAEARRRQRLARARDSLAVALAKVEREIAPTWPRPTGVLVRAELAEVAIRMFGRTVYDVELHYRDAMADAINDYRDAGGTFDDDEIDDKS
jgi:hypothetical protein